LQMLGSGERRVLVQAGHSGFYAPTGHLVYYQSGQGTLMAVPFSLADLEVLAGTPVVVAEGVLEGGEGAQYTLSGNGSLAYVPGYPRQMYDRLFLWVNRNGKAEPLKVDARAYEPGVRLSPDGQKVAFGTHGAKDEVWFHDITRGISSKLASENGSDQIPIWTPDGKRLTYRATRAGTRNIFWRMSDGSGTEERLTTGGGNQSPASWSPDGQVLAFEDISSATGEDIWTLRLSDHKQQPIIQTPFNEGQPRFSPDGRWLAYNSDQSGRYEIYVQPYPGPGGKVQISTDGGTDPLWNRNGRELFYRDGSKVLAVTIVTQPSFSAGKPKLLFDGVYTPGNAAAFPSYDVSPDGQRFLMIKPVEGQQAATQINIVQNWFEELKRRVPSGK
jgi:Tol biopolymer transport system component